MELRQFVSEVDLMRIRIRTRACIGSLPSQSDRLKRVNFWPYILLLVKYN